MNQPTLITHKKLIGEIYTKLIKIIINYISSLFLLDDNQKRDLKNFIFKQENIEKILIINTPKKIRNSLINR